MSLTFRAGPLRFFGDQPRRIGFNVTKWGGWNGGVSADQQVVKIPQGDGAYDVPSHLNSRNVSLEGYCLTESLPGLGWYGRALAGMVGRRMSAPLYAETLGKREWTLGKVIEKPEFDEHGWDPSALFAVEFWCPKPQIFGDTNVDGPAVTVTAKNYGNFPATSQLTIAGAMAAGYTISGPLGREYIVTRALVAGHEHTIDMVSGQLLVDGLLVFGGVSRPDTWAIPGGGQVPMTITGTGTATITVRTRDTNV